VSQTLAHPVGADPIDVTHKVILYLEDVTVSFDGFKALDSLTLAIDDGEMRAIIGPNGAGKTTMMDVITGRTRPATGRVFLGQTLDLTRMSEARIARAGIGRKFQKPSVFEQVSVVENLWLACPVTVLHQGSVLAQGDLATVQADPRVIDVYLGR
jgi:urea transport system ATP-binding protein